CSRKHLVTSFSAQIGLPPKTTARILRFHGVVERLVAGRGKRLSEIAHNSGYYDHAHFDRDFREFAGMAPRDYLAIHVPRFGAILPAD
ncbi:MAG: helix-turn-helix domain-containing protein, partial [Gemmatimonadaceae bacterium]